MGSRARAGLRLPEATRTKVRGRGRRKSAGERATVLWPVLRLRTVSTPHSSTPQRPSMFQKGAKRKFEEASGGEEEEEEEAVFQNSASGGLCLGVAAETETLGLVGEDSVSLRMLSSYSLQRQMMLNMSLVKLQLCHMLVEPNLCRSVLIANTVRHIQEEMTYDLTWQVGAAADAFSQAQAQAETLSATSDLLCRSALTDEEPERPPATPFNALNFSECEDTDGTEEVMSDRESPLSSSATPSPLLSAKAGIDLEIGLGPCWQGKSLCHSERMEDTDTFSGRRKDGATMDDEDEAMGDEDVEDDEDDEDGVLGFRKDVARPEDEADGRRLAKTTEQIFSPLFEANRPTPVPEAALEDIMSDVEASYYDLDSMLTGMQGVRSSSSGATGIGCNGGVGAGGSARGGSYELLESLSTSHSQTHSQLPLNPSTGCRLDLSELDHIMEIIVGS